MMGSMIPARPSIRSCICRRVLAAALACLAVLSGPVRAAEDETLPPAGMLSESYEPSPGESRPGFFEEEGAARSRAVAEDKGIELDTDQIQAEQSRALRAQDADPQAALYASTNAFTEDMDLWHERAFRWLDNSVRTLDLWGARKDGDYSPEISTFALTGLARVGGRGDDGNFEAKARFGADLALPGLQQRLHIFVDNLGRDELPGADQMKRDDNVRVGVHAIHDSIWADHVDVGGGLRLRHGKPVGYVDIDWDWSTPLAGGKLTFVPRGVWYTDDGFGEDAAFSWIRRSADGRTAWRLVSAETAKETSSGLQLEETVQMGLFGSRKGHGWVFRASLFPHLLDEGHTFIDDVVLAATWRAALYRRWIFYTLTPQFDFAEEDRHHLHPSLTIGIEILFGGETKDIM